MDWLYMQDEIRKQDNKHLYKCFNSGMSDVQRSSFKFYHDIGFDNFQQLQK